MVTIKYCAKGTAFSDFDILTHARELWEDVKDGNYTYPVSTRNIIDALRVLICKKEINNEDIVLECEGDIYNFGTTGDIWFNHKIGEPKREWNEIWLSYHGEPKAMNWMDEFSEIYQDAIEQYR